MTEKKIDSPIDNPKREKFAQLVASGQTKTSAFKNAGYSTGKTDSGWRSNAANLANQPDVRQRIADLIDAAAKAAIISRAYVLTSLQEILQDSLRKRDATPDELEKIPDEKIKPGATYNLPAANTAVKMLGDAVGAWSPKVEEVKEVKNENMPAKKVSDLASKYLKDVPVSPDKQPN